MTDNYFTVYDWMTKDLGLRGNDRCVFAVINSFTENRGEFTGSLAYLAETAGVCKSTVVNVLHRLTAKGLLVKRDFIKGGVRYCAYRTNRKAADSPLPETGTETDRNPDCPIPKTGTGTDRNPDSPIPKTGMGDIKKRNGADQNLEGGIPKPGHNTKDYTKDYTKDDTKEREAPPRRAYEHFGEYGNVLLTREELELLRKEYPDDWQQRIDRLSEYMASTGKRYRSHLATIRSWARQDAPKEEKKGRFADLKGGLVL